MPRPIEDVANELREALAYWLGLDAKVSLQISIEKEEGGFDLAADEVRVRRADLRRMLDLLYSFWNSGGGTEQTSEDLSWKRLKQLAGED